MKIRTLREFAQNLYHTGTTQDMEFAKEIMSLIDFEENSRHDEICEDLEKYAKGIGEPIKQVEWLGDRSNLLADIEQTLENFGHKPTGTDDSHDAVTKICEALDFLQSEIDALNTPDEKPAGLEYDL